MALEVSQAGGVGGGGGGAETNAEPVINNTPPLATGDYKLGI